MSTVTRCFGHHCSDSDTASEACQLCVPPVLQVKRLWVDRSLMRLADYQDYHLSVFTHLTHATTGDIETEGAWDAAFDDWDDEEKVEVDGQEVLEYKGFFQAQPQPLCNTLIS